MCIRDRLYGTPLEMTFTGLDPEASYGMKVFYPNSFFRAFVGQTALKDETLVNIRAGKVLLDVYKRQAVQHFLWRCGL